MPLGTARTYENFIAEREVSLAIEHLLIAPAGTSFSPTRITYDTTGWPSGFRSLGPVVEDSVALTLGREKFQLVTGIPKVLQYEAVIAMSGKLEAVLHSNNPRRLAYMSGNVDPTNSIATTTSGISSVINHNGLVASHVTSLAVGDVVVWATSVATLERSFNEAEISSITGNIVYFSTPGFPALPSTAHFFGKVLAVRQAFGTSLIQRYSIIGVADFIDGVQIVHYIPKASPGGEQVEKFMASENAKMNMMWDLFGTSSTSFGTAGSEQIVAQRWTFYKQP